MLFAKLKYPLSCLMWIVSFWSGNSCFFLDDINNSSCYSLFFLQFVPRSDFRSSCWSFYHPWLISRGHFLVWGAAEFMHGYVHLIWSFIWCSYISPVTSEHLPENCKPPVILRSTAPQRHILSIQVWLLLAMQGFLSKQLGCQACKELADIKPHAWICSSDVAHYMRCMPLYG